MDLFDVAVAKQSEKSIDAFIEKRAREKGDADVIEEFWAEQDRRERARRREGNRLAWVAFHRGLARSHSSLCEEHRAKTEQLAAEQGAT